MNLSDDISMPRLGDAAPDFDAVTTVGPIKFSEYHKDSWAILFSHPADFTPVCTTELVEFARESAFFTEHNTKLIGLSIDSIYSHIAWVNNIRQNMNVLIDYPLIADHNGSIAALYGMLHPRANSTLTVRAVFFIDPKNIIRLILYYPLNIGRNIEEIKRALIALQTAEIHTCSLPVNWKEGERVILPTPKTIAELDERQTGVFEERIDFYLVKRSLE